ncbi:MAG: sugar phosphate isomerase/epimerase [Bacteroidetes bacterium]|nr:sugar phosphate isomerase/epimerase [Bacteroidota bacterium]
MAQLLLNTLALDPHRWTPEKVGYYRLEALLAPIAEAGFHGVELWQYHLSRESKAEVQQLRTKAEALGVCFPVVGMYPQLNLDGKSRGKAWDEVKKVVDYAALLGAEIVKIFVGSRATDDLTEAEYERSLAFLADLVALAGSRGLTITGETHAHTLFDSIDACRAVLKAVGADNFKVCFQPYDLTDTGQALAQYDALRAHVVHVHYQGRRGDALTLLREADLDYDALTRTLAARGFDGYLCIELVKECIVETPALFDLKRVLHQAQQDRDFVLRVAGRCGMAVAG